MSRMSLCLMLLCTVITSACRAAALPDLDCDGQITEVDLSIFLREWAEAKKGGAWDERCDLDGTPDLTAEDARLMLEAYMDQPEGLTVERHMVRLVDDDGSETSVTVSVPMRLVVPGQQFDLPITIGGASGVAGIALRLHFDASVLTCRSMAFDEVLVSAGSSVTNPDGTQRAAIAAFAAATAPAAALAPVVRADLQVLPTAVGKSTKVTLEATLVDATGRTIGRTPGPVESSAEPESVIPHVGDLVATGDPEVGSAVMVLRAAAGLDAQPAAATLWQWDCNDSGSVDCDDAVRILRCVAELDPWPMDTRSGTQFFLPANTCDPLLLGAESGSQVVQWYGTRDVSDMPTSVDRIDIADPATGGTTTLIFSTDGRLTDAAMPNGVYMRFSYPASGPPIVTFTSPDGSYTGSGQLGEPGAASSAHEASAAGTVRALTSGLSDTAAATTAPVTVTIDYGGQPYTGGDGLVRVHVSDAVHRPLGRAYLARMTNPGIYQADIPTDLNPNPAYDLKLGIMKDIELITDADRFIYGAANPDVIGFYLSTLPDRVELLMAALAVAPEVAAPVIAAAATLAAGVFAAHQMADGLTAVSDLLSLTNPPPWLDVRLRAELVGIGGTIWSETSPPTPGGGPFPGLRINVPARPDVTLTASPMKVALGDAVRLTWQSRHATEVVSSTFGATTVSGQVDVVPSVGSTTYGITVRGGNVTAEAHVAVEARHPYAGTYSGTFSGAGWGVNRGTWSAVVSSDGSTTATAVFEGGAGAIVMTGTTAANGSVSVEGQGEVGGSLYNMSMGGTMPSSWGNHWQTALVGHYNLSYGDWSGTKD